LELTRYALEQIGSLPGATIYGPREAERRGGVVAFNVDDIHPHDLGQVVDYEGVAIRAGHHCCQVLMDALDVGGTARASFYIYNTPDEVDVLVRALLGAQEIFGETTNGVAGRPV
ncbi:MAG: aminotransferase class V-fold PLP-dependent enzyme, partial [Chloroflexi bacterium]|nr:aminotransferase class V-fold PLP-dependent enzyme [Chloroflexota bacterium]